jgi:hypothetical protein
MFRKNDASLYTNGILLLYLDKILSILVMKIKIANNF